MRFYFSLIWGVYLILAFYSHVMKTFLVLFLLLFFHEMAHVLCAMLFHVRVSEMILTPFGFYATIDHLDYLPKLKKICILLCGLFMHVIYPFVFFLFLKMELISNNYFDYLVRINNSILLFNLLPIYPLDGARIIMTLLELFFSYPFARKLIQIISVMIWIICFYMSSLNMKLLFLFLGVLLFLEIKRNPDDLVEYVYTQRKYLKSLKNHV